MRESVLTKNAASSTVRANTPAVSSVGDSDLMPAMGSKPKVGL